MIEIKSVAQMHTYSDNQCMGVVFDWTTEKNHLRKTNSLLRCEVSPSRVWYPP